MARVTLWHFIKNISITVRFYCNILMHKSFFMDTDYTSLLLQPWISRLTMRIF